MYHSKDLSIGWGAMGSTRLGTTDLNDENRIRLRTRQMLARALNTRTVVAFIGSGVSLSYKKRPGWDELAKRVIGLTNDLDLSEGTQLQLKRYQNDVGRILNSNDVQTAAFSTCQRELRARGRNGAIQDLVHGMYSGESQGPKNPAFDPLLRIMENLGIRRFITTNYDDEIQAAWRTYSQRAGPHEAPLVPNEITELEARGLTSERALDFSLGIRPRAPLVFHAHGRAVAPDLDATKQPKPNTPAHRDLLLVSTDDYNQKYADDSAEASAYRETLRILFAANAVLFLGVGMTEYDLLGPLRLVEAQRARTGYELPVFALMSGAGIKDDCDAEEAHARDVEQRILLNVRYGVKALHYRPDPTVSSAHCHSAGFCNALEQLALDRDAWSLSWQRIPRIRSPSFPVHGQTMRRHGEVHYHDSPHPDVEPVVHNIRQDKPVVLVHQRRSGSGSDELAAHVADRQKHRFEKAFIASLYLTHDLLSVIESAGSHLEGSSRAGSEWPTERLMRVLAEGRYLLIITGCERLLRRGDSNDQGTWTSEDGKTVYLGTPTGRPEQALFAGLANLMDTRSRVVLVGSTFPQSFWSGDALKKAFNLCQPKIYEPDVWARLGDRYTYDDAREIRDLLHTLQRLSRGHPTSFKLCRAALSCAPAEEHPALLSQLASKLSNQHREDRVTQLFGMVVQRVAQRDAHLPPLLEWIARFTCPVDVDVLNLVSGRDEAFEPEHFKTLQDLNLIRKVVAPDGHEGDRWAAPLAARRWAGRRLGGPKRAGRIGLPQRFGLAGFTRDPDDHRVLSDAGAKELHDVVDRLIRKAQGLTYGFTPKGDEDIPRARRLFRAAYDLVRTHFGLSVVRRITPGAHFSGNAPLMTTYHRLLLRLANLLRDGPSRSGETTTWLRSDIESLELTVHDEGWLYVDELAWLLNEVALVPYTEGQVQDAKSLFRMVRHAQAPIERQRRGWRWARDQMFLGAIEIDRARLVDAHELLLEARHGARQPDVMDRETVARCEGYLGLVAYLRGFYAESLDHLKRSVTAFPQDPNHRATSLFQRIRGDVLRHTRKFDKARAAILAAQAAADRGGHPDLRHYAAMAEILKCCARRSKAELAPQMTDYHAQVRRAESFAKRMGSSRLLIHSLTARIKLQEINGDMDHAWEVAKLKMIESRKQGMRLAFISALAHAGYIAQMRGRPEANKLLNAAEERAVEAGFALVLQRIRHVQR